jgi:rRNA maturation endonuclease Nob1
MERNLHTDDFERLLREKSDEFRLYPSKRIWHSIYNNIHPGHRWPSVAMCITLISALLLVGYLNTRNTNSYSGINKTERTNQTNGFDQIKSTYVSQSLIADVSSTIDPLSKKNISASSKGTIKFQSNRNSSPIKKTLPLSSLFSQENTITKTYLSDNDISGSNELQTIHQDLEKAVGHQVLNNTSITEELDINEVNVRIESKNDIKNISVTDLEELKNANELSANDIELSTFIPSDNVFTVDLNNYLSTKEFISQDAISKSGIQFTEIISQVERLKLVSKSNHIVTTEEKNWIDNYALYNRPAPKKWANKLDWQIYATPSVVYRTLTNTSTIGNTLNATPFAISSSSQNINSTVTQTPSLGFELGTGLKYLILKNVRIKGGLQFNFTRYNAHAFGNSHPVATKLTMHNFETKTSYEVYRSTSYSNNSGLESVKLHNQTFQISLPVGVDLKLIGNERLQWNVGATIQPTYVAGGKSYLISSDRHNYVKETSMLNRWNLNAGFETFIAFKSNGLTWQIGPQFRKQLFTTNNKTFAVEEKLVTYGVKFGISKTLK